MKQQAIKQIFELNCRTIIYNKFLDKFRPVSKNGYLNSGSDDKISRQRDKKEGGENDDHVDGIAIYLTLNSHDMQNRRLSAHEPLGFLPNQTNKYFKTTFAVLFHQLFLPDGNDLNISSTCPGSSSARFSGVLPTAPTAALCQICFLVAPSKISTASARSM